MRKSLSLLPVLLGLTGCFKDTQSEDTGASSTATTSEGSSTDTPTTATGTAPTAGPGTATGDEGTGTGTGGATDTGDTTTGAPCPGTVQTLPPARPAVMLVLDRSGSMMLPWNHDGDATTPEVTRWSSLHAAVSTTLTTYEDRVAFGLVASPSQKANSNYSQDACVVASKAEVSLAPANASKILAAVPPANSDMLEGADPIAAALSNALAEFASIHPALPRRIVLISNGLPQCHAGAATDEALFEVYDPDAAAVAAEAFASGIRVQFLGLGLTDTTTMTQKDGVPNSVNYFAKYEELAAAGGTPFFNAITADTLPTALTAVLDEALTGVDPCVVPLEVKASEPGQALVEIDGELLAPVEDCVTEEGWHFVGEAPHAAIELCGAACAALKSVGAVDVFYCDGAPD